MATLTLNLGTPAAAWTVYLIVYDSFDYDAVWWPQQGVFTGPPTFQLFEAGSVTGVHQGGGVFSFVLPTGITTPGVYPVRVFRDLGLSERNPDDQQLTYDIPENSYTIQLSSVDNPFIHSAAEIVCRLLKDAELVAELGSGEDWMGYTTVEPDKPDNVVTLYDTAGTVHGRVSPGGESVEDYGIQVRIRGNSFHAGWTKAKSLRTSMTELIQPNTRVVVTSAAGTATYNVHALCRFGNVLSLGRDRGKNSLHLFTLNLMATITRIL